MGESARAAIMGSRLLELRSAYSHSIPASTTTSESISLKGNKERDDDDDAPLSVCTGCWAEKVYIRATGYPGYSDTGDRWAVTGNVNKQQETVGKG